MIDGLHAVLFTRDADALRAFLRDVLELPSIDAGGGWDIFGLPPAEIAAHPADEPGGAELYLLTADIEATAAQLRERGIELARPISDEGWGLLSAIELPGGGKIGLYQPRHERPPAP